MLDDYSRCTGHAINENRDIEACPLRSGCLRYTRPFNSWLGSIFAPDLGMIRGSCELLMTEEPSRGEGKPHHEPPACAD